MVSETVPRPQLRRCQHPDPKQAHGMDVYAFRVWIGKYKIGTIYKNHPKGKWLALHVTGNSSGEAYGSSNAAVQFLVGHFDLNRPRSGDVEAERESPFLKYLPDDQPPSA